MLAVIVLVVHPVGALIYPTIIRNQRGQDMTIKILDKGKVKTFRCESILIDTVSENYLTISFTDGREYTFGKGTVILAVCA